MNKNDEILSIDTPENVIFGYEIAGIGSRFIAALVDTIIITLMQAIIGAAMVFLARQISGEEQSTWAYALGGLFLFALSSGYYIFFEITMNGQSPGKRLARLRVIRSDGLPITLSEAIIRNLVRMVDFLPYMYGVGVVSMFISQQSRRLGDLAAGTLVVHDRDPIELDSLRAAPMAAAPQPSVQDDALFPVERLSPDDLNLAEDFLRRRGKLSNNQDLALRIAKSLLTRMEMDESKAQIYNAIAIIQQIVQTARAR